MARSPTRKPEVQRSALLPANGRAHAYAALRAILDEGASLDGALTASAALPARERAFAHTLAATVLRRLGETDAALAPLLTQSFKTLAPDARALLRLGAVQHLFLDIPSHAAVATTVMSGSRERIRAMPSLTIR